MSERSKVKPGDWVRFYQNGTLRLGVVVYVKSAERWPHNDEALTDIGSIDVEYIQEVRRESL